MAGRQAGGVTACRSRAAVGVAWLCAAIAGSASAQDALPPAIVDRYEVPGIAPAASGTGAPTTVDDPAGMGMLTRGRGGFFSVARQSIFGENDPSGWTPLRLGTFFTEGWDQPWVNEPNESGDAAQGWINAADGNFYRLYFFAYNFTRSLRGGGNGQTGSYTLYLPLSRRLEVVTVIPFVTSQPTFTAGKQVLPGSGNLPGSRRPNAVGFGDLAITPRIMLADLPDFDLIVQTTVQIPTGYRPAGAGQAIVSPGAQFWWNFAEGWVMRGGFSPGIGTNRQAGGTTLLSQLALGKTLTPDDVPYFGDFTLYLSTNVLNNVSSSQTLVTLTPGYRTHLGGGWYSLGGVEVPVTGPRPFQESAIFWIMKTF